ncbi:dihydrofolate reductase [Kaistia defluvii]|uniref:dihydrofolate reductase n=1 Tax=Kaistia defluvii TaxID=410841 RepID=UPI0022562670|nr:dihydrofolate reductase [Kaistia defluvii]MCX5516934.1 dihydrofolate reductase [Kaistia defluvii]
MTLRLSIIAAVASNGVIGQDGDMPWKLSTDLKRFKALTTGKPVIMGRRTFASIGRPLPNRVNIVLTRDKAFGPQGVVTVPTLDAALEAAIAAGAAAEVGTEAETETEAMVIGGGEIYRALLDRADRLYITHVDAEPAGDTHFPALDPAVWEIVSSEAVPAGASDTAATRFTIYQRRRG